MPDSFQNVQCETSMTLRYSVISSGPMLIILPTHAYRSYHSRTNGHVPPVLFATGQSEAGSCERL
jgi:hypothetical protein